VLNVTASAVSQRIRQLEDRLGQVLIQRSAPCRPTIAGKALARYAEQISVLEAEALRSFTDVTLLEAYQLRVPIAVNADSLESWFIAIFEEIPTECPIYFDLHVEHEDYSSALLRDGSVLAAITTDGSPIQGCRVMALGSMAYLAVASREFVQRYFEGGVDGQSLAKAPMITFDARDALQCRFMRKFVNQTPSPPTHFIPSSTGFVEASRRGVGWCMVPELMAARHLKSGELVEISPGTALEVPLYLQHWGIKSEVLDTLGHAIRAVARRLLKQNTDVPSASLVGLKPAGVDPPTAIFNELRSG